MIRPTDGAGLTDRLWRLFWNPSERRPRMPFRLVGGLAIWLVVGTAVGRLVASVLSGPSPLLDLKTTHLGQVSVSLIDVVVGALGITFAIYLAARYVDRRWFRDYGLRIDRRWWVDLAFGFTLGGVLMTGIFLLELAMGWITVTGFFVVGGQPGWTFPLWFLVSALAYVAGSIIEELLYRGFLFTNLAEGFRVGPIGDRGAVAIAIALTSGGFALGHATALHATTVSTASIALAGVFLALGYVVTGQLAVPIGVHIAWNFFEGNLYGFPISGTTTTSIITTDQSGPDLLTGGRFGPEAGLLGVAAILLGIGAVLAWARYSRGTASIHERITTPELRR